MLSRDDTFADTLAVSSLAGDGALLLTQTGSLPASTSDEIDRLLPSDGTVYLLGGADAIAPSVATELTMAGYDVRRLEGPTRVETAVAVADEVLARSGGEFDDVVLARSGAPGAPISTEWADSVSGGAWAADTMTPVLLTPSDAVHPAVAAWLSTNTPTRTVLLGGEDALSAGIAAAVPGPARFEGLNRYDTAATIATDLWASTSSGFIVTPGDAELGWAFGLAAAGLGADLDYPVVLVEQGRLPAETDAVLACNASVRPPLILIGDASIGDAVRDQLGACG